MPPRASPREERRDGDRREGGGGGGGSYSSTPLICLPQSIIIIHPLFSIFNSSPFPSPFLFPILILILIPDSSSNSIEGPPTLFSSTLLIHRLRPPTLVSLRPPTSSILTQSLTPNPRPFPRPQPPPLIHNKSTHRVSTCEYKAVGATIRGITILFFYIIATFFFFSTGQPSNPSPCFRARRNRCWPCWPSPPSHKPAGSRID